VKALIPLALFVCLLTGCVSTRTIPVDRSSAAAWRGKSVALTVRPRSDFIATTAGKASFGLVGALAMIGAGKSVVAENGIEEPAPSMNAALLKVAQDHFGLMPAATSPVTVDTTDPAALAKAAAGADLLFDMQTIGRGYRYLPLDWTHYVVDSSFKFRIVDVGQKKIVAEVFCAQTTQKDSTHPSGEELLANKATRLKEILLAQQDQCINVIQAAVLASSTDQHEATRSDGDQAGYLTGALAMRQ
jgi:hypothetical protein